MKVYFNSFGGPLDVELRISPDNSFIVSMFGEESDSGFDIGRAIDQIADRSMKSRLYLNPFSVTLIMGWIEEKLAL